MKEARTMRFQFNLIGSLAKEDHSGQLASIFKVQDICEPARIKPERNPDRAGRVGGCRVAD